MGDYRTTAHSFDGMSIAEIRDPIITGPGHPALVPTIDAYRALGETFQDTAREISAALKVAVASHEGVAAEASQQHLGALVEPGNAGWAQARLAANAVQEQADHHVRARNDVQHLQDAQLHESMLGILSPATGRALEARDAAALYQANSNANLDGGFQAFVPPEMGSVGIAPAGTGVGSGGGGIGPGGIGGGGTGPGGIGGGAPAPSAGGTTTPAVPGAASFPVGGPVGSPGGGTPGGAPGSLPGGPAGSAPSGSPSVPAGTVRPGVALPPGTGMRPGGSGPGGTPGGVPSTPGTARLDATRPSTTPSSPGFRPGGHTPGRRTGALPGGALPGGVRSGWSGDAVGSGRAESARPEPHAPGRSAGPGSPTGTSNAGAANPAARPTTSGVHGAPMMGGAGTGASQPEGHRRPSWLLLDDPQEFWFRGMPDHTDPVIGGEYDR